MIVGTGSCFKVILVLLKSELAMNACREEQVPIWALDGELSGEVLNQLRESHAVTVIFRKDSEEKQSVLDRALIAIDQHHGADSGGGTYAVECFCELGLLGPSQHIADALGKIKLASRSGGFTLTVFVDDGCGDDMPRSD